MISRFTMLALGCVSALLLPTVQLRVSAAIHSSRVSSPAHDFAGATFVPQSAPTVNPTVSTSGISLAWNRVTTSAGIDADYRVVRTSSTGSTDVCTGADTPVVTGQNVTCTDRTAVADTAYTYTQQPILVRDATVTWSRPASSASATVTAPRVVFANAGATVTSTGSSVTVAYPTGTQVGDVLMLVSTSGRQNAPTAPVGWSQLASVGVTGGSPLRLFVAWRVADAATSLTWDPNANGTGATVRIVRYVRANGNVSTPVVAAALVPTSTGLQSTSFASSPDIVTNAINALVVNVVAMRTSTALSLSSPQGFVVDYGDATAAGTVGQSVGVAGVQKVAVGQVPSPTWLAASSGVWASASVAFR